MLIKSKLELNMAVFTTLDLYDEYGDTLQVMEHGLSHFGKSRYMKGQAVIIRCPEDNSLVGELLRQPGDNKVLIVDAQGSKSFAFLGDNLAISAIKNQWSGIIVNGCVRDVEILKTLPFCVIALGHVPRKTKKQGLGSMLSSLTLLGAEVSEDDWVYADENGVVISKTEI